MSQANDTGTTVAVAHITPPESVYRPEDDRRRYTSAQRSALQMIRKTGEWLDAQDAEDGGDSR